ncbi:serine/threonine-protein kinase nek8 [Plakobranchus ocellatus]|uniref:non-specific serine/threonine protein kinase n=1 Tax=Plakobranchus ocellatus TaxID=259542 RepID=A0AAV4ATL7_9GAST|nr:serine/threonine-protein kinase nek8 [Plakobranchus ocellatus]
MASKKCEETSDASLKLDSEPETAGKHVSTSLQNIRSECTDAKPPPSRHEQKQVRHRRSKSNSSEPNPVLQRSNSCHVSSSDAPMEISNTERVCSAYGPHLKVTSPDGYNKVKDAKPGVSQVNRLVVVSSKVRNVSSIRHALMPGVGLVQYNCDSQTLEHVESQIVQHCRGGKIKSIAFLLGCVGASLQLLVKDEKVINKDGGLEDSVRKFFTDIVNKCMTPDDNFCRIDFLGWYSLQSNESPPPVVAELQNLTGVTVGVWHDLSGQSFSSKRTEETPRLSIGDMYFRLDKLRNWSGRHQQSLAGFEKIRTVGKGAYGTAVLYKKKDDESLVILKEINMHDLNSSERQLALNEVSVLALLDHPNIVSYYDSFEEDGVLMIEIEYADNGTLAQHLAKQDKPMDEKDILLMFQQIVAAIRHIHSHNILHRDLKTDNIFLTKEGVVKVGDFGISKMLGSANIGAQTVLGTPYYISPEMCEGKQYSFKSDIWALGCILYEMVCFQKTFEGSNLPAVVNKIVKAQFPPIKANYSDGLKDLIKDMLKKNPEERPEANYIMYHRLPSLMSRLDKKQSETDLELNSSESLDKKSKIRSLLVYFESSTTNLTCINGLPPRMKIKHMAVGPEHVIVTTTERQVYTWGHGGYGELGHGDIVDKFMPALVEALQGKSIATVCCGLGFSVFGSDNGLVLTCGDGSQGCLGHGDWCSTSKPRLIESLLSFDVVAMASGMSHVVVIGREGQVMSWGDGSHGQLGLGSEENQCTPTIVQIAESVIFTGVQCGVDGTMLISDVGGVFACGNNENNKLGLNNRQGFLMAMKNIFTKTEVDGTNIPTPVRALARHRVLAISMGLYHTAVIVEPGHVITFGKNSDGQLGAQNTKPFSNTVEVKALEDKCVSHVQCGDHYTIASTRDHKLYYWGLRYMLPPPTRVEDTTSQSSCNDSATFASSSPFKEKVRVEKMNRQLSSSGSTAATGPGHEDTIDLKPDITDREGGPGPISQMHCDTSDMQGFRPLSSVPKRSASASSQENSKDKEKDKEIIRDDSKISFEPMEVIKILVENENVLLMLGNIYCHGENFFIQIETTAPPPRRRTFKKRIIRRKSNQSFISMPASAVPVDEHSHVRIRENSCSSDTSELDTHSTIPTWLRQELAESARSVNDGNEADDTSGQSEEERLAGGQQDSSMSSIHINRALTPVAADSSYGVRTDSQSFIRADKCSPRNLIFLPQPRNAHVSHDGINNMEIFSDSSSCDTTKGDKMVYLDNSIDSSHENRDSKAKTNDRVSQPVKSSGNQKFCVKGAAGRGRGTPFFMREKPAARGFISDVTAKRREEALLFELDRVRQEKYQADARVKLLESEREANQALIKQEVDRLASERESALLSEVERLRSEIQAQSSLLEDREQVVGQLQNKLESVLVHNQRDPYKESDFNGKGIPKPKQRASSAGKAVRPDDSSNQATPRAESSTSSASSSTSARRSSSRLCLIQ